MPSRPTIPALLLAFTALAPGARATSPTTLDDFSDTARWHATTSEGVEATATSDDGALRLDIDFRTGAGYGVVRRELGPTGLSLPDNFALSFDIRAERLPPNNLEFKLVTPESDDGIDVWWHNRRAFGFPREWTTLTSRRRHFEFAWGPSGGDAPLDRVIAIEFGVASAEGGEGTVWLDNLRLHPLPAIQPYTATPRIRASAGAHADWTTWRTVEDTSSLDWTTTPDDPHPRLRIDFRQPRALAGIIITWSDTQPPVGYRIQTSLDGANWTTAATRSTTDGARDAHFLPDTITRHLRIDILDPLPPRPVTLRSLHVIPADAAADTNAYVQHLAAHAPRGHFPQPFAGRQTFWTVLGVPRDTHEALFSEHGAIEISKGGPTLEPFLLTEGRLITWADVVADQALLDDTLPIPTVTWTARDAPLTLSITPVATGAPGESSIVARYRVTNTSDHPVTGALALALRPFQVLPPWQRLNLTGGVAHVESLRTADDTFFINDAPGPRALTPPARTFLATFDDADIVRNLTLPVGVATGAAPSAPAPALGAPASGARSPTPPERSITDDLALASGAFIWDLPLAPRQSQDIYVAIPLHARTAGASSDPRAEFDRALAAGAEQWRALLSRTTISLPPSAARIARTIRSNLAYILINQDGPAIQPGSRTYERSWIRDGAVTSAALLALGHHETVRDYLAWYAAHQFPSGKVPCVVDRRGPDPVDEHDSTGQLIFALRTYADVTGDVGFLRAHFPNVLAGVEYLRSLRARRLTSEYADPDSPLHSRYGLVPESISHEGYSAKPMHSYWDDFWVLRGLEDAAAIARTLDEGDHAARMARLADDFRADLFASIGLAMAQQGIDFIPGCVELGDFDPTSTGVAIHPLGLLADMPQPATRRTFDRYWSGFLARRDDTAEWHDYTPYEARIIGALVLLDEPDRAHALLDWLLLDQHPPAWNHWAEVAYRDDRHPGWIGDMPHTWVGAGFINSAIAMLAYHRRADDALVLAAGVKPQWLTETPQGVGVTNLHTTHGPLTYSLSQHAGTITLALAPGLTPPPGGIVLRVPGDGPVAGAAIDGTPAAISPAREVRIDHAPATVTVTLE